MAVCDAFDAMTSDRCYERARPKAEAIEELRRNAGTRFDSAVVDALCAVIELPSAPARGVTPEPVRHAPG